jgi:hypothetical protein
MPHDSSLCLALGRIQYCGECNDLNRQCMDAIRELFGLDPLYPAGKREYQSVELKQAKDDACRARAATRRTKAYRAAASEAPT